MFPDTSLGQNFCNKNFQRITFIPAFVTFWQKVLGNYSRNQASIPLMRDVLCNLLTLLLSAPIAWLHLGSKQCVTPEMLARWTGSHQEITVLYFSLLTVQAHFQTWKRYIIIKKISVESYSAFTVCECACLSYHDMTLCYLIYVFTDALTEEFVAMHC